MRENPKIFNLSAQNSSLNISEQRKLADQCLDRITILQEQIGIEEEKLFGLLEKYGEEVISDPELVVQ